jgi:hypothetical protein
MEGICRFHRLEDDFYLKNFTREESHVLIDAFAMAVRDARFSKSLHEQLVANTVRDTVHYVCATFRENGHPNLTFDKDGRSAFILQLEFRAFKNTDPEEKHQKAIPISVISKIAKQDSTKLERATAQLTTMGIFFAMRSCEYLKVKAAKQQRTEIVRLHNIHFFSGTKQLSHDHPQLEYADCIAITFECQKKDEKMDTITLLASEDAILCPVRAMAAIVKKLRNIRGPPQTLQSPRTPTTAS